MNLREFSKKELFEVLDLIQAALQCKNESDMIKLMSRVKELVCSDHSISGLGTVDAHGNPTIVKLVNESYPADWLQAYACEGLFKKDPVLLSQLQFFKPLLWTEVLKIYPKEFYTDFMQMAADFRLRYGLASGMGGYNSTKTCIFSFSGDKDRFKPKHKKILDIVTPHLYQALLRIWKLSNRPNCKLTAREKEIINLMKAGKTNWEISVILNMSERTAKFHVQNIVRKLDAVNKAHAVAIALDYEFVS